MFFFDFLGDLVGFICGLGLLIIVIVTLKSVISLFLELFFK